mmetsp:Transcript_20628/g.30140  ORF Transcript_20628/g.30140 Transcript_20628/m.30140 type:complete len:117 (+) Transcript_20628:1970-2320(+)
MDGIIIFRLKKGMICLHQNELVSAALCFVDFFRNIYVWKYSWSTLYVTCIISHLLIMQEIINISPVHKKVCVLFHQNSFSKILLSQHCKESIIMIRINQRRRKERRRRIRRHLQLL